MEKFYSQDGQDKYIYENFFKGKNNGIFIDIGANDGITLSNTYFFENLGWRGYCIEPIDTCFSKLIENRKNSININGIISNKSEDVDFLLIEGYSQMLSGELNKYDPRHLDRINIEIEKFGGNKIIKRVKSYLFNDIINEINIDYLSIDVEGGELDILKTIDFNKYKINIISVENNYSTNDIKELLTNNGFNYKTIIGADEIFVNKIFNY